MMIVAQIGCLHGEMDKMYEKLQEWEQLNGQKIDVVLCCGDFQSLRDRGDLDALKCPAKFKTLGGFAKYFSREKRAPYLTLFVGGNHEASNLLRDLYYGGYVAENIYFLGYSNVINVKKGNHSLRVSGISGIEKSHDSRRGYFEEWPYTHREKNITSMFHIRQFEAAKLQSISSPVDIMISHEWPTVATSHKSYQSNQSFQQLLRYKPFFKQEIQRGELGSPLLSTLLESLTPRVLWCSAHLHCQFRISVPLPDGNTVEFQSLDKPEGNKRFADVFSVQFPDDDGPPRLSHDGLQSVWDRNRNSSGNQHQNRHQQRPQMVYMPKQSQQYQGSLATIVNAEEETKQELKAPEQVKIDDKVELAYDKEWIAVLQLAQEMIPLEYNAPLFDSPMLTRENVQEKMAQIEAKQAENSNNNNLRVFYDAQTTYQRNYERVHPQTRNFIERFGLDDRLFQARQKSNDQWQQNQAGQNSNRFSAGQYAGNKRTYNQANLQQHPVEEIKEKPVELQVSAAAAVVTVDENEIDLDDL